MSAGLRQGTQGYGAEAPALLREYESRRFEDAHRDVLDLIPPSRITVLDIGAGTGRDAAWFAARGDAVTAMEPTREMREGAMALHPSPNIAWIDDGLPELASVCGRAFELVWMSAVWMHFGQAERASMFPTVASLVAPGGALMISQRYGPIPAGRRMFEVSAEETSDFGMRAGLRLIRQADTESARQPGVRWTRLWLQRN